MEMSASSLSYYQSKSTIYLFQVCAFIFTFCVLHKVNFVFAPTLSVLAVLVAFIIYTPKLVELKYYIESYYLFFVTLIFFILYCSALWFFLSPSDNTILFRSYFFVIYSVLGAIFLNCIVRYSYIEIIKAFLYVAFLQSLLIILDFFSPSFHQFLLTYLEHGSFAYETTIRAIGFSSEAGSALSVTQFIGFFAGYLLGKVERNIRLLPFIMSLIIFASTFVTGRMGLLLCLPFLIHWCFVSRKIALFFIFTCASTIFILFSFASEKLLMAFVWVFNVFTGEDKTVSVILGMHIPPLSESSIVGSGMYSLGDGSNASGSDIGYIQNYYAMGLINVIIFYVSLFFFLFRSALRAFRFRSELVIFILMIFIVELKEPFIFKYNMVFFILALLFSLDIKLLNKLRRS